MIRTFLITLLAGALLINLPACSDAEKNSGNAEKAVTKTTYILVRHAEKADDGTKDPPLTEAGQQRAVRLARMLKAANVGAIYSTDYQRTRQTARPLANERKLEIDSYDPFGEGVLEQIKREVNGKTALIVGHSNTVPVMVNQLLGQERIGELAENEYDKLFIVTSIGELAEITILNY